MPTLLAFYIHHLDPFAIRFSETFGVRWYGIAYVAGFVAAYFLLRWFIRIGACDLKQSQVADFITICAIFGVMLGGRLGYMLLYRYDEFIAHPLTVFDIMGGGMASHGGIAGLVIATWFYARYTKLSWTGLGDNLVTVAPVGLFFGRIANFINGELYGRITNSRLAMKFPDELTELIPSGDGGTIWRFPTDQLHSLAERASDIAPGLVAKIDAASAQALANGYEAHYAVVDIIQKTSQENPAFREMLGTILNPRHPSQLYEALVEGLLLFVVMLAVRLRWKKAWHGILTGLFFILYAVGRISVENFREPDAERILGITRGQFYSLFMIAVGIAFLAYAVVTGRRAAKERSE